MRSLTIREAYQRASSLLTEKAIYPKIAEWILKHIYALDTTAWLLEQERHMTEEEVHRYFSYIERVLEGEPYQYIIGTQDFYGRSFLVNPAVLIPRPETEISVDVALALLSKIAPRITQQRNQRERLQIVDVGTGSGALAITLALEYASRQQPTVVAAADAVPNIPFTVSAIDISVEALEVAKRNAEALGAEIQFFHGDCLEPILQQQRSVQLLISNPPYIAEEDEHEVEEQVLHNEPRLALFAPEEGYYFYRKLIEQSLGCFDDCMGMVFEVGHKQAQRVAEMITAVYPQAEVQIHQDLQGRERVVSALIGVK